MRFSTYTLTHTRARATAYRYNVYISLQQLIPNVIMCLLWVGSNAACVWVSVAVTGLFAIILCCVHTFPPKMHCAIEIFYSQFTTLSAADSVKWYNQWRCLCTSTNRMVKECGIDTFYVTHAKKKNQIFRILLFFRWRAHIAQKSSNTNYRQ